uniref:IBR domain-containing protein n=1 Tax=Caenorhabditis japonica TaxID=281687 RepID=A0A8R1HXY7_CAEJA
MSSDTVVAEDPTMFEKPRGERRWLGKHHHHGKERLYQEVKDRTFIEKKVSSTGPLSQKATEKIGSSTKDGLQLNVVYSLDKKKRWKDADKINLLASPPEDVNAEVVERNALEQYGFMYPEKSTFAVHSRDINATDALGEFDVRSATSVSGRGQHYSNFAVVNREMSKKANAKMYKVREEEKEEETPVPTVSYNIYKTHPSSEVVGSQLFKGGKPVSKSGRHRANKNIDMVDEMHYHEDEEFSDEEEARPGQRDVAEEKLVMHLEHRLNTHVALTDYLVDNDKDKQKRQQKRKDSEQSYEIVDVEVLRPEPGYVDLLDIQSILRDEGHMFEQADVTFRNQSNNNYERQIKQLRGETGLTVKDLRENQFLIDASGWCQLENGDGETTTVIVITHLKNNTYNVLVNSTIANHPSKRGADFLRKQIANAATIKEAIALITTEILTCRKDIETLKLSSSFYGRKTLPEMLHDAHEWENAMLNMSWPNRYAHATWANSKELSTMGGKQDWKDVCSMIRKENRMRTCYTNEESCGVCHQKQRSFELFVVQNESRVECCDCLRNRFYQEFRAKRIPIDLQTDTADELEYLPTFIPLTVINLYIRMTAEQIYQDIGATGSFQKCPSCLSAVYFDEQPNADSGPEKTQNRSCPCGYTWCKYCDKAPHWPLMCGEFAEWEEKWLLRYSMMHAQGSGTEQLLQVTCSCAKSIYHVLLPADFIKCPTCKVEVNMNTMNTVFRHYYFPYQPRFRKLVDAGYYQVGKDYENSAYVPRGKVYTDINKIPGIKAQVLKACGEARDVRFNFTAYQRATNRELHLVRRYILPEGVSEDLFATSAYLAELVTAWMYMRNQYDRSITNTLAVLMETREELTRLLEGEDKNQHAILNGFKRMRNSVNGVVSAVVKMKKDANY